jgi:hypothetical protein
VPAFSRHNRGLHAARAGAGVVAAVRTGDGRAPAKVTVWLPDGASAEEQARTVERARAGLPVGVAVTARRYRQSSRR